MEELEWRCDVNDLFKREKISMLEEKVSLKEEKINLSEKKVWEVSNG